MSPASGNGSTPNAPQLVSGTRGLLRSATNGSGAPTADATINAIGRGSGGATGATAAASGTVTATDTAPTVTTAAAGAVTATTIVSGGDVTADGGAPVTARGVVYATSINPRVGGAGVTQVADVPGTGTGSFVSTLTGLSPGTFYYLAAYATNSVGTSYGGFVLLRTLATSAPVAPTVTTATATSITVTTATSGGTVTADGGAGVTARGVVFSTTAAPRLGGAGVTDVPGGTGTGSFASALTGLTAGTTYFVAAYATNSAGTSYGADVAFTTTTTATPLVAYDFPGSASSGSGDPSPTSTAANVTAIPFIRVGVTPNGGVDRFNSTGWETSSTVNLSKYVGFTFTVAAGFQANLSTLTFTDERSNTGPSNYAVRVSTDEFATSTLLVSTTTTGGAKTIDLSSQGAVTGTYAIRIYGFGATTAAGTYSVDAVRVFGTITTAASAPTIAVVQNNGTLPTNPQASIDVARNGSFAFATTASGATTTNTFFIKNTGAAPLNLSGPTPITLSGSPDFAITQQPVNFTNIAVGDSVRFVVAFTANSATPQTATVVVASPDASNRPFSFTLTGQTLQVFGAIRWDGGAGTDSYADPTNWDSNAVPTSADNVLLDHKFVVGAYTVVLPGISVQTTVRSLSIKPGTGPAIEFIIPSGNTAATPMLFTNSAVGDTAVAIYSGGVLRNASGAGSGSSGIDAQGTNATVYILNGGTYRHETPRAQARLVENLVGNAATVAGNFVFAIPTPVGGSSIISTAGPYGNLTFTDGTPGAGGYTYNLAGAANVRGTLTLNATARLATTNNLTLGGNLVLNGVFRFNASTARTLLFNGTTAQTISGNIPLGVESASTANLSSFVTLETNNSAGLTLLAPVLVNGNLRLTDGLITTTANNLLTIASNALDAKQTSFVNGPVGHQTSAGAATVVFPIGRGTAYRPLVLNTATQSSTTTFVAEVQAASAQTSAVTAPLVRVSGVRYFTLTPLTAPTDFSANITLSFGPDDLVNFAADAGFVIANRPARSAAWTNIGRISNTGPAGSAGSAAFTSGTLTAGAIPGFFDFALASTTRGSAAEPINPLPVGLSAFTAVRQPQGQGVQLRWTTASEQNNAYFEVQRSLDGQTFGVVAKVAGQGSTTQLTVYAYLDRAAPAGPLYYRLRQVDTDGKASFSPVRSVGGSVGGSGSPLAFSLFPNPATTSLSFPNPAPGPLAYRVLNQLGQTIRQGQAPNGLATLNIASLAPGIYSLALQTSAGPIVKRFVKE